jgi:hypothetical protein
MEAIDEALLLLLGQAAESRLAAEGVFLAGEGFSLVALEPVAEVLATRARRGRAVGGAWARSVTGRGWAIGGTRSGRGRSGGAGCGLAGGRRWMRASTAAMLCVGQRQCGKRDRKQQGCRAGECTCRNQRTGDTATGNTDMGNTGTVRPDGCAGRAVAPSCIRPRHGSSSFLTNAIAGETAGGQAGPCSTVLRVELLFPAVL